ncbi:MAG: trypsin-like peptidase domain-containing protein [Pirellulaceae bacterium]
MLILKLLLLSIVSFASTDLRVLFFTMDACPPCKQTEPNIDRLAQEGAEVAKIDVNQHADYAAQCQVTQTPTVMVIDENNRVLARHTGAMTYDQLRQLVGTSGAEPASSTSPPAQSAGAVATAPQNQANLTPEQRAYHATVRFRVEDDRGTSYATGTIVHRVKNEALVLTCGHVFRDSQGQGKINADLGFAFGEPKTVIGKLLFYDAQDHDIALVAIPCTLPIDPVPVAPEAFAVQTGDRMFSLGCDHGEPPTLRETALKAVTRYSGIPKYDIVGRPVDGRSGGGLFSAGGQLVGVCNAAAVEVDEGIYAGLQSVYWQFAKTNLTHLLHSEPGGNTMAVAAVQPSRGPAQTEAVELPHPSQRRSPSSAGSRAGAPAVQQAVFQGQAPPTRPASHGQPTGAGNDTEMIVVVRSRSNPARSETIVINNPGGDILSMVRQAGSSGQAGGRQMDDQIARMPDLQRPQQGQGQPQMRAQSPR